MLHCTIGSRINTLVYESVTRVLCCMGRPYIHAAAMSQQERHHCNSLTALGSAMNTECTGNVMHKVDFLYYMPDPP